MTVPSIPHGRDTEAVHGFVINAVASLSKMSLVK